MSFFLVKQGWIGFKLVEGQFTFMEGEKVMNWVEGKIEKFSIH